VEGKGMGEGEMGTRARAVEKKSSTHAHTRGPS